MDDEEGKKRSKRLHELMQAHGLRANDVASILDRSPRTIRIWRVADTDRPIPKQALELLELKIATRQAH